MRIKEKVLNALDELAPNIDPTRSQLELDISTTAISRVLSEKYGLPLIEYIIEELDYGKKPIYQTDRLVGKARFDKLIEQSYVANKQEALGILLPCYHQFWMHKGADNTQAFYDTVTKLENSDAIERKIDTLTVCLDCYNILDVNIQECEQCKGIDLLKIYGLFLTQSAKAVLKNNQYLEIYVKECLRDSGVELIGHEVGKQGKRTYTSIQYQVHGEMIEADVHGIAQPLTLLLCEVKTTTKITMNEIRRVENLFDRLVDRIRGLIGTDVNHLKLFIITGEFDRNISIGAYRRRNWELIDRAIIPSLTEEFKRIKSEL